MNHDHQRHQSACGFSDREGRDSAASHEVTRRIVLGPIGAALALVLIALLAIGAVALIAGAAQ